MLMLTKQNLPTFKSGECVCSCATSYIHTSHKYSDTRDEYRVELKIPRFQCKCQTFHFVPLFPQKSKKNISGKKLNAKKGGKHENARKNMKFTFTVQLLRFLSLSGRESEEGAGDEESERCLEK